MSNKDNIQDMKDQITEADKKFQGYIGGLTGIVEKSKLIGYDVAEEILDQAGTNFIIKESKLAHTIYKRGN